MKFILRIPTDMYAYTEAEFEGTAEEAKQRYDEIKSVFKEDSPSFNSFLISLVDSNLTEWGDADHYEELSAVQKDVMQSLKRFAKRIKYENGKTNTD